MYFFNVNVKYLRERKGLSQNELAKILNFKSRDNLNTIENKNGITSMKVLIELRNLFNINLDDLIFKDLSNENNNIK